MNNNAQQCTTPRKVFVATTNKFSNTERETHAILKIAEKKEKKNPKTWCLFQQLLDPVSKALKIVAKKSNDHAVFSDFSSLVGDNSHSTSGKTLVTNNTSEALISRNNNCWTTPYFACQRSAVETIGLQFLLHIWLVQCASHAESPFYDI